MSLIEQEISEEHQLRMVIRNVFSIKKHLIPLLKEYLEDELSEYDDEYILESIELLKYWREDGVDYSKMDKLSIISERAKML